MELIYWVYLIININNGNAGVCDIKLDRIVDGVNTTMTINRSQLNIPVSSSSYNVCIMYKLEVGGEIYCKANYGNPLTNLSSFPTDDTLNSFWGIRMDY